MKSPANRKQQTGNSSAASPLSQAVTCELLPVNCSKGFTLVEIVIAVALFTVVMTVAASAYLAMISLNRHARSTNDVVANLSFAVETISRSIRTGSNYNCIGASDSPNCWLAPAGQSTFSFTNDQTQTVTYLLKSDGRIGECTGVGVCTDATSNPITDPRITINSLKFYTRGVGTTGSNQTIQPRVIISISGSIIPNPGAAAITFTIQTLATQRLLEL